MAEYVKECAWCHRQFKATRSDAVYCSSTCRHRHWRKASIRAWMLPPQSPYVPEGKPATEREVVGCFLGIRQQAAQLSAAALTGPEEYRPLCRRVSERILDALEVEGI